MISVIYTDDEPDLLEIGRLFLEREGRFAVDTATSAKEALEKILKKDYDAIISDYQMPEINGIEFLQRVRAAGNTIPFIIFTGRGREEVVIQALNEGADFYLQKGGEPLSQFAELADKIEKAVRQRRTEASIRDHERREADIINFLPDATFAIDTRGVVIAWNRAMEMMTGVAAAEILGEGNHAYALPFYHERRRILIDLVLADDPATEALYPYVSRAGNTLFSEITIPHMNNGEGAALWFTASPLYDNRGRIIGAIESIRDVTERKKAEAARSESERRFRELADLLPQAVYEAGIDGTLTYANRFAFDLFGYAEDELRQGLNVLSMIALEDRKRAQDAIRMMLEEKTRPGQGEEFTALKKNGSTFPVAIYSSPVITGGRVAGFRGIIVDISERRSAESELQDSVSFLNSLIDQSPTPMWISDENGVLIRINRACLDLLNIEERDVLGKYSIFHDNQIRDQGFIPLVRDVFEKGIVARFPIAYDTARLGFLSPDRTASLILDVTIFPVRDARGRITNAVIQHHDITEQRRAVESLRQSEASLSSIFRAAPTGIGLVVNRVIVKVNDKLCRMTGYSPEELIGRSARILYPTNEDYEYVGREKYDQIRRDGTGTVETRWQRRDGTVRDILLSSTPLDLTDHSKGVTFTALDITDRKQAEARIIENEQRLQLALEGGELGTWNWNVGSGEIIFNERWTAMLGYRLEEIPPHITGLRALIHPDDAARVNHTVDAHLGGKTGRYECELRLRHKDGSWVWVLGKGRVTRRDTDGTPLMAAGTFLDITARKQMERELKESEGKYRAVFETTGTAMVVIEDDGAISLVNTEFERLSGYARAEIENRMKITEFISPEDLERMLDQHRLRREDPESALSQYEFRFRSRQGGMHDIHLTIGLIPGTKKSVASLMDITERKIRDHNMKVQLELGIRLQKIHGLQDTLDACLSAAIDISGMDAGGIYLIDERTGSVDLAIFRNLGDEYIRGTSHYPAGSVNAQIVMAGTPRYAHFSGTSAIHLPAQEREGLRALAIVPITFGGSVIGCLNIASHALEDIMVHSRVALETIAIRIGNAIGRIRGEEALAASEERYRNVVEDQTEFISRFLPDGTHVFVNEAYCRYFGLSREDMLGHRFLPKIPPVDRERLDRFFASLTPDTPVGAIEHRIVMPDGSVRWQRWIDRAIFDESGVLTEYQSVGRDVTDRKETEEALHMSMDLLDATQRIAKVGGWEWDVDRRTMAWTDETYRIHGFEPGSIPAGSPEHITRSLACYDPGDRPAIEAAFRSCAGQGTPYDLEGQFTKADGTRIWVRTMGRPVMESGRVARVVGNIMDITERKNSEAAIRETGERLRTVMQAVQTGIVLIDTTTHRILDANKKALSMIGAEEGELIGSFCQQYICPSEEGRCPVTDLHQDINAKECIVLTRDGRTIPVFKTAIRALIGGKDMIVESFSDITELKEREDRIRLLGGLLDLIPASVTVHDESGKFLYANAKTFAYHGYTQEEFYRINLHQLDIPASATLIEQRIRQLKETGESSFESSHFRKDGSVLPLLVNAKMTTWEGTPVILSVATDITRRLELEKKLHTSEQDFITLANNSPDLIVRFDTNLRHVYGNPAAARETGFTPENTIGRRPSELPLPADVAKIMENSLQTALATGMEQNVVQEFPTPLGSRTYETRIVPERDDAGTIVSLLAISRDITGRVAAENALRKNEARYRSFVENSLGIAYRGGIDFKPAFIDGALEAITGYTREDFMAGAVRWDQLIVPEDLPSAMKYSAPGSGPEGAVADVTYRITRRDGTIRWVRQIFHPFTDASGAPAGSEGMIFDITGPKLMEQEIRRNHERLDLALWGADEGIIDWDLGSGTLAITERTATMLGYRPEDFPVDRNGFLALVHPDDRSEGDRLFADLLAGRTPSFDYEERMRAASGGWTWILARGKVVARDADGRPLRYIGTHRDISRRKEAEELLRISEARLTMLFNASPVPLLLTTPDEGRILAVNEAALSLFGYLREEILGKTTLSLGIWVSQENRRASLQEFWAAGSVRNVETQVRSKSGQVYDVLFNSDTTTADGRPALLTAIYDITGRKEAERAVAETTRKINLLDSVTRHDVANQVTLVRGFALLALAKAPEPGVAVLLKKIDAAASVISGQIEFTRLYRELGMHSPEWFRIKNLVLRQQHAGIAVSCTCDAEVHADPMLEKVFFNLIDNARRHGERVTEVTVRCEPAGSSLAITVEDNGIGIPSEQKEAIFEKGFGKHTGLGLFLAREILAITGITIHETGTFGKGARFVLLVPAGRFRP